MAVKQEIMVKSRSSLNGARSSVVERFPDKKEVHSSILCAPTKVNKLESVLESYRMNFDTLARHNNDFSKNVNGIDLTSSIGRHIDKLQLDHVSGPFLGLGAGLGVAERSLAERLGLRDITLVDTDHEDLPGFDGYYIAKDMFEYLEDNPLRNFGIVTVLGLEYVLNKRSNWARLWHGIKNVTKKDSLVVVYPHDNGFNIDDEMFEVKYDNYILIAQRVR